MSIYLDEKNPGKHKPFDDAAPDIVEYVRYLEVLAGKSANTAFSYYCGLRGFSSFMKRRRGLVPVSYTHLDVYKRQASICAMDSSSASSSPSVIVKSPGALREARSACTISPSSPLSLIHL